MLDIGFSEILVIALIGLIFIGPDRLPETVRTISLYIGRFKRSLRDTRREIEQQLGADDIRRELHNEEVMRSLDKLRNDVKKNIDETLDLDEDFYPPGHHDHDPNNDIDDDVPEPWPSDATGNENTIGNNVEAPLKSDDQTKASDSGLINNSKEHEPSADEPSANKSA